jgi:hypothetical protein
MFYWAPEEVRKRFKYLVDSGLKGSGDYGVLGAGVYNGQSINLKEKNDNRHAVLHLTYPFQIGSQIVEVGSHAYTGRYNVTKGEKITGPESNLDTRVAGSFILYPQPIGFQAEFNIGKGPELVGSEVLTRNLHGGYAMAMVRVGEVTPYVRGAYYEGGRKNETNSPHNGIRELETGLEVQFQKWVELTAAYNVSSREVNYNRQDGHLARLQVQFNY